MEEVLREAENGEGEEVGWLVLDQKVEALSMMGLLGWKALAYMGSWVRAFRSREDNLSGNPKVRIGTTGVQVCKRSGGREVEVTYAPEYKKLVIGGMSKHGAWDVMRDRMRCLVLYPSK
ncbi:hypothetical protein E3N88_00468 [Mikania micrantha]|uniref:Uncharacterized protein n=1 Tax=Mikania micrantha TaxID=192012 RepID=A0A5N6PYI9_9ASTR|nr:hypothetical protein E3N88_00468 [Mikania micrantha]